MADLPPYITAYLEEEGVSTADPLATFATLRLDALDLQTIAGLIEEGTGSDVADVIYEAWQTLADVAETAAHFAGGMTPAIKEAV